MQLLEEQLVRYQWMEISVDGGEVDAGDVDAGAVAGGTESG